MSLHPAGRSPGPDPGPAMAAMNPLVYAPRSCQPLGNGLASGLSYKLYLIRSNRYEGVPAPDLRALHATVATEFDAWGMLETDHPLAFAIVHLADDGWYLLLSRWNNANNLRHRVRALEAGPRALETRPLAEQSVIACVWEMRLMMHEADAWIDAVLRDPRDLIAPDMAEHYLAALYEGPL